MFAARLKGTDISTPPAMFCEPCPKQPELQPAGSEQLGPATRGSVLRAQPPELPRTRQQQLDEAVGAGNYVVNEERSVAACQRCSRFNRQTINLLHPAWLANAIAHHATHPDSTGMRTLDAFGFGRCTRRLADAIPAPALQLDYDSVCHGYWLPAVEYGGATFDTTLLNEDWRPGAKWAIDPTFTATVECSRDGAAKLIFPVGAEVNWTDGGIQRRGQVLGIEGEQISVWPEDERLQLGIFAEHVLSADPSPAYMLVRESSVSSVSYSIARPYRHSKCSIFCVDTQTGEKRPNLMCTNCASVPKLEDFKARLIRRATTDFETSDQQSIRFDRLPTVSDIIEHARETRASKHHWKLNCTLGKRMLGRSYARERLMRERLDAQLLTGDLAGLAADLQYCQQHQKFEGKPVMLNFLKDVVHDLRLKNTSGQSSRQMRWHESTKRLGGVLQKFGGPRCHRLQRLNIGAPSARTVGRCWNGGLFRYPTGSADAVFAQLAKELKPKVASLGLKDGEKLPCEFQLDETPILRELSYSQSRDSAGIGSCGWGGESHRCDPEFAQRPYCIIGDDGESAAKIDRLCAEAVRAGYLRLALLKRHPDGRTDGRTDHFIDMRCRI